ncbi:hypothetical protein CTEN210_12957 [Chaetoceros tenuissimus]|uniref:PA14 domain-containing protein n=1 Tax=Chaetoceros tenuissimus TaxID=426638 RepID=A0AAD3D497_9STRA|nr:hypothetical protein CTEN210_12957 [Chaetoceros tenuissimus]
MDSVSGDLHYSGMTKAFLLSRALRRRTIIAGYPSGDKRLAFTQLEGLTGLSARDEWDFKFLGVTNQPFIKADYPHHEGIWGWEDEGDQVILIVSDIQRVMVQYHDILWDIGYAQTFEEAYERIENLYKEEEVDVEHQNPPVEDFLVWRDLRVFDEIHWYSWFIDFYMENGLMRDIFNHEKTVRAQWMLATMPHYFTKHETRFGRFVEEGQVVEDDFAPMCQTLAETCYPVLIIDPEKLIDPLYGPTEARKMAELINGTEGFEDWMIEEEAWECIWNELITERKGIKTFLDRVTLDYESYQFSFELKNEMHNELQRLISKYEVQTDQVAQDLVNILRKHRDRLGVTEPMPSIDYERLLSYHLEFPPFFPHQKEFISDDDFYVNSHAKYLNIDAQTVESIIDRRRKWFEEEMRKKRKRVIQMKYFDATNWSSLPAGDQPVPYKIDTTYSINYNNNAGEFATSERSENVAASFEGRVWVDNVIEYLCVESNNGSKVYVDGVLAIDNDGLLHSTQRKCVYVKSGNKADFRSGAMLHVYVEYLNSGGNSHLVMEWGTTRDNDLTFRTIPPRSWASVEDVERFRQLIRQNELLEEDLRTLKETDFMGPTTRKEYNYRKAKAEREAAANNTNKKNNSNDKHLRKRAYNFKKFDEILKEKKANQLKIARDLFE